MNDEIREILKNIKKYKNDKSVCWEPEDILTIEDVWLLSNYITNSEERISYLERSNNRREDTIMGLRQELAEQKDYKSRCEKASENCKKSIEAINEKLKNNREPFEVVDGKIIYLNDYQVARLKAIRMKCKELLNILDGGSEK